MKAPRRIKHSPCEFEDPEEPLGKQGSGGVVYWALNVIWYKLPSKAPIPMKWAALRSTPRSLMYAGTKMIALQKTCKASRATA